MKRSGLQHRLMALSFCCLMFLTGVGQAQTGHTLSPALYKALTEIHELMGEERHAEARAKLKPLLDSHQKADYGRALLLQTHAHLLIAGSDYAGAARSLQQAVDLDQFSGDPLQRVLYNLAQLYIGSEQYAPGIKTLERWFTQADNPQPKAYILLANAHVQLEQYHQARQPVQTANRLVPVPQESWLKLELAVHHQLNDRPRAIKVLERLVAFYPERKRYWLQLSGLYGAQKQHKQALGVLELAYHKGLLDQEQERRRLANLYLYLDTPLKGAEVLQRGLKEGIIASEADNWERLANAWQQAREMPRALDALQQAAELAQTTDLYLRLGQLHAGEEQWQEAAKALATALRTGTPDRAGHAYLLLGMARLELGRTDAARKALKQAITYPKTRQSAEQWLAYLDSSHE